MKILRKLAISSVIALATIATASVGYVGANASNTKVEASTSYTYGENQIYSGVSSASTNRIHATHGYTVRISQRSGQKIRFRVFRYGHEVHSRIAKGSTTISYSGSGDYSVRIYNNSKNSLKAGVSITAK